MKKINKIIYPLAIGLQCILLLILMQSGVMAAGEQRLSAEAANNFAKQLQTLKAEKKALTPVQRKVNSNIIRHLHTKVLRDWAETLPKFQTNIKLTRKNEILVDIKANVTDSLLATIRDNGGTIINQFPQYRAIRALIPITAVEVIAAHPDVQFIDTAAECETHKYDTSEGDVAHNAPVVRAQGYTGAGIKVGVLSDSVDHLADVQLTGDLPAVTVLEDSPGESGEGTAMLEIVYDLAPAAPLYFATAWKGPASFANNIIALKNAGCKVIVDDVSYFNESPFQDDVISQAVSTVTAAGVLYFSSAANSGNKHSGAAGTWEGDYVDGGSLGDPSYPYIAHCHAFLPGHIGNQITKASAHYTLFWSDPLGGSGNDYDLYIADSGGNVIAVSESYQSGTEDPYEHIDTSNDYTGYYLVINNYGLPPGDGSAAPRFLHLNTNRGRTQYSTNGNTKGHCTVDNDTSGTLLGNRSAFGVAAVSAYHRVTPFTGAEAIETFSSDGPRRIFYNPDGTAITPGNFLHTGGRVRLKPDITAADGVHTAMGKYHSVFDPFYGTSAAAPHAAAIAALLLSADVPVSRIRHALTSTALPSATWNDYAGYGIIMADRALNAGTKLSLPHLPLLLLGD